LHRLRQLLALLTGSLSVIFATMNVHATTLLPGTYVSGRVSELQSSTAYTQQGGTLITPAASYASQYLAGVKLYVIKGAVVNGKWDFTVHVQTVGQSLPRILEIGVNNAAHTQLVALGTVTANAPSWMKTKSPSHTPLHQTFVTPSIIQCYPNYTQHQLTTTWYEYVPGLYPGHTAMAQQVFSIAYYYNNAHNDANCPSWNDSEGQYQDIALLSHSSICTSSAYPIAYSCAANASWQGTDQNYKCVDVDINSATMNGGYAGEIVNWSVNTHAFYCNTSTQPSDWYYNAGPPV